ncbi:MAG: trehalose-phosphatase [Ilumatobacteraceae bacterium]
MTDCIDPAELVALVRSVAERAVLGFDVDGVLAPIVGHADDARLTPGVDGDLDRLAAMTEVAVVSGRSLADLEQRFGFSRRIHLIGSHGLEVRGEPRLALDDDEQQLLAELERLASVATRSAGPGAWLERKPASVVVHTRNADDQHARSSVEALLRAVSDDAVQVTFGHEVVELFVRPASKGLALDALRHRLDRPTLVYGGDDRTDETVFAVMNGTDIGIHVGEGDTLARYRLGGTDDVADLLRSLVAG